MRHRKHTFKIGRSGAHRRAMLANMVSSLILEQKGEIKTTITKAKEARRFAEKMVTRGKKGDLHSRRIAISKLRDKEAVSYLFSDIAPRYAGRNGGYTRIIKLGRRKGDAAEMCILQWVESELKKSTPAKKETAEEAEVIEEVTEVKEEVVVEATASDEKAETKED